MTITWHVDNLKISHAFDTTVDKVITWLSSIYGTLTASQDTHHDYLGMDLDYSTPGKVIVSMEQFTQKIIAKFPETRLKLVERPADDILFQIREEPDARKMPLPEARAQTFHRIVAMLLFLVSRSRRNCKIVSLTTRVSSPNKENWGKLRQIIRYLKRNPSLGLTLEADDMSLVN